MHVCLLLLPAGCALWQPAADRTALVPPLEQFTISGRIAVKYGDEAFSAHYRWRHFANQNLIDLISPLGQTVARLSSDGNKVRLVTSAVTSEQQETEAASWDELTERELGWPLPIEGLLYWIQGLTSPQGSVASRQPQSGQLQRLEQDGWQITYLAYQDQLPQRLLLKQRLVEMRLVIDSWAVP